MKDKLPVQEQGAASGEDSVTMEDSSGEDYTNEGVRPAVQNNNESASMAMMAHNDIDEKNAVVRESVETPGSILGATSMILSG